MSQYHARMHGRARQKRNNAILAVDNTCHLCGHPGSDAIDHVIPLARGGTEERSNLRPAHHTEPCPTCGQRCNRLKSDKLMPEIDRRVVLICGPPGAGKTTLAHTLGLQVYDLDDEQWAGNDSLFRASLVRVREDPKARAAVIRTGATKYARRQAVANCGATEIIILDTPYADCVARIKARGRTEPPISYQVAGARQWWSKYEPGEVGTAFGSLRFRRSSSLNRT